MSEAAKIVTGIGKAELHRILVRGYDLNKELVGHSTFTDMTSLILRGRLPTANEAKMLDALMIILVEDGMVSHVIAARLIYHCAPEAMQAAAFHGRMRDLPNLPGIPPSQAGLPADDHKCPSQGLHPSM